MGDRRLIVRRTRLIGAQAELFPDWRHFALATNRADDIAISLDRARLRRRRD